MEYNPEVSRLKRISLIKRFLYLVASLCILCTSCEILDRSNKKVVISVGSTEITEDELLDEIKKITYEMGITDQEVKQGIRALVNRIIDNYLILEYGKEKGITLSEIELVSAINNIKKDYPENVFDEVLLQQYIEYDEWKEWLRRDLLLKKIVNSALAGLQPIEFSEAKEYFDSHKEEFMRAETVQLAQIVLPTQEKAEMVLKLLTNGEDIADLAKKYSITPEGKEGGLLGWIEAGSLQESIEEQIFSLPVDRASKIIKTPYGYHIFKVLDKRPAGLRSLSESMGVIEERISMEKKDQYYKKWLMGLRERLTVQVDPSIYNTWNIEG